MTVLHKGGCLCGSVRYETTQDPLWTTVCYCRFCQRATGSDRMIEPIFDLAAFRFSAGDPAIYTITSEGSGKMVHVHFCRDCGTKLALTFERWPDRIGIYIGTLDNPAAIVITPETSKHVFTSEARPGTILPPFAPVYERHATDNDGTPIEPTRHDAPWILGA